MTITVKVGEAKTRLSELLARVEAGEEVVIQRGYEPIARLTPIDAIARRRAAFHEMIAERDSGAIQRVRLDELMEWKHEGHRF